MTRIGVVCVGLKQQRLRKLRGASCGCIWWVIGHDRYFFRLHFVWERVNLSGVWWRRGPWDGRLQVIHIF